MPATKLGTLITYNPWSVGPSALLDDVAARFDELRIHHVPVVNDERQVIGMLSETDLLRARQQQRVALVCAGAPAAEDAPAVFARDGMTRDVVSISPRSDFGEALGLLLKRQIHALPVVEEGKLVGVLSSRDFLREFSYGEFDCAGEPISKLLRAGGPEPLDPDASLDEALIAMHEAGVSCLAVVQGNCPLGLVSQREIVREKCRLQENGADECKQAASILRVTKNSPPIRSGQRLSEAAAAMIDHSLPAVTVVNQSNRLLGLVTEDDLLQVLYDAQA